MKYIHINKLLLCNVIYNTERHDEVMKDTKDSSIFLWVYMFWRVFSV